MLKACVIGHPIKQSLSPVIHGHWIDLHNIDGEYTAVEVSPESLSDFVATAKSELAGFNITVPHKQRVMEFCDELSPVAKQVGAVNTVHIKDGKLYGDNTDVYGITQCILNNVDNDKLDKSQALIVGAGGASRACVVALKQMGFKKIIIANRTEKKARDLADEFGDGNTEIQAISLYDLNDHLAETTLLLNSSTAGMNGDNPLKVNLENAPQNMVVCDIVYKPLITPLLADANEYGLHTITGIDMLLYQAVAGFNYWFGIAPSVDEDLRKKVL